jgi:uncharacterized protein (TIGR02466 family)
MNEMVTISRTDYFPTMVYQFDLPDPGKLNAEMMDLIYQEREADKIGVPKSNTAELGSWHSNTNLHKSKSYDAMMAHIHTVGEHVSEELGYARDHELRVTTMWSIINPPGNGNRLHVHPGAIWSGVYYVQTPENSGDIEFVDPRTALLMNQPKYLPKRKRPRDCWTKVNYKPVAGRMLLFPSWLYHGVDPNMATAPGRNADRVIISFNMNQVKKK